MKKSTRHIQLTQHQTTSLGDITMKGALSTKEVFTIRRRNDTFLSPECDNLLGVAHQPPSPSLLEPGEPVQPDPADKKHELGEIPESAMIDEAQ